MVKEDVAIPQAEVHLPAVEVIGGIFLGGEEEVVSRPGKAENP